MRRVGLFFVFAALSVSLSLPADKSPASSRCHIFVDYENIWTLEMVQDSDRKRTPILNVITFQEGEQALRPRQVHLFNQKGKEAKVKKFSLDTGVPDEPYTTNFIKVLDRSFIGLDLKGNFGDFAEPSQVDIDLGELRFELQAIDCEEFEILAEKINNINVDSPDIKEDFCLLKIEHVGKKELKAKGRR